MNKSKKIMIISIFAVIAIFIIVEVIITLRTNDTTMVEYVKEIGMSLQTTPEAKDNTITSNNEKQDAEQNKEETNIEDVLNIEIKNEQTGSLQASDDAEIEVEDKNNKAEIVLPDYEQIIYGYSENGRDLTYSALTPSEYENTLLFVFAIHGYEDDYDKDGQVLVDTANYLVEYYKNSDESLLHNSRLLIVECANPDGLYDGYTNNGFGRCNAKGIDLNRDFNALHKVYTSARNYTSAPFSAKESKALANLIQKEKPIVVLDFHGWLNCTIGDGNLARIFKEDMSLPHQQEFSSGCGGYLSYYAHTKGANALLVEFKDDNISRDDLKIAIDDVLNEF